MKKPEIKYVTQTVQRKLGDKVFVMEVIRNLDEAIDQICEAMTEEEKLDPFAEDLCPYFGVLWPAAEALSEYIYDHPELIRSKSVLELGSGLGYPSLVATYLGGKVLATDFHPDVEAFFKRNCRHSSVECAYRRLNWREEKAGIGKFDVVMGSDVLYESKHPEEVAKGLLRFRKEGGIILLSDPGRSYMQNFLSAMKELGQSEDRRVIKLEGKENYVFVFRDY
jgi:predicted nicotinamide N-methyase